MTTVSILSRLQYPYVISSNAREIFKLLVLLSIDSMTLFVLDVDHVGLRHSIKDVHSLLLVVLFESQKEARLSSNQVDAIDVVVDLVESQLSENLNSAKLGPYQVRATLALLLDVSLIILMRDDLFLITFLAYLLRGPRRAISWRCVL